MLISYRRWKEWR